jgi:hypothetical protein
MIDMDCLNRKMLPSLPARNLPSQGMQEHCGIKPTRKANQNKPRGHFWGRVG